MFQDLSTHLSKFLSTKLVYKNQRTLTPHRLDDNFHWKCSTCRSIVPSHETHIHLSSCLDQFNSDEDLSLSPNSDHEFENSSLCFANKPMDKHDRPRTKKLERPTPNIRIPVINELKNKSTRNSFNSGVIIQNNLKKISISSENKSKSLATRVNQIDNCKHDRYEDNKSLLCNTCDRDIAPEKFHCHHINEQNKLSVIKKSTFDEQCTKETSNAHSKANYMHRDKLNFQLKQISSKSIYKTKCGIKNKNISNNQLKNNSIQEVVETDPIKQCTKESDKKIDKKLAQSTSKDGCDPAGWQHFKSQLIPCSRCNRTFFPHRLSVHEKSCKGITKKRDEPTQETNIKPNIPTKPIFLDCTTCGRKYSTTSLTLHELKCRNYSNNRRLSIGKSENEINIAWEHFKTQLVPCAKCKRKFLPDRLEIHEPVCKASPLNRTINNKNN